MAKQIGAFKAKGSIGDFSFYKTRDGAMVRMKGGVDGDRIKKDPAFARTRENGLEFGRAAKRGQLIRSALRSLIARSKDSRVASRMLKQVMDVMHSDSLSARGERDVLLGELNLLTGFEFNKYAPLESTLFVQSTILIDRGNGELSISLPDFTADSEIHAPDGSTHFRLVAGCSEIDWVSKGYLSDTYEGSWTALNNSVQPASTISLSFPANSLLSLVAVLGIEFGQEVNTQMYPLNNGAHNSLKIVVGDQL